MRIELDGNFAGSYLEWRVCPSSSNVEIVDILSSKRRVGVGKLMIDKLLSQMPSECRLVYVITRASNSIAQEFYESVGFVVIGVLRDFYSDSQPATIDAVVYGRRLKVL